MTARSILVVGVALLAVAGSARAEKQLVFPAGSEQPLAALQDIDVIEHIGERVPTGLTFADEAGRSVTLASLLGRGKPLLDGLVKAGSASGLGLGKDFLALDVSIDPTEDPKLLVSTQRRVLELAGKGTAAGDWPFWRSAGDGGAAARALADAVGFRYKYDPDSKQYAHEAVAFVLTPEGTISRYLYGVEYPPRDFRLAVVEAGGGRVGTSFDKVVLSCYRYDPATRRYAPFVMAFMRIGAGLVFIALCTLLTVLWRKEIAMRKRGAQAAKAAATAAARAS